MTPNTLQPARFLTHLDVDADDFPYTLASALVYYSARLATTITVPAGFVTDFASIPWLVQWLIPKEGRYNRAAVVHDWLYTTGEYPRDMADYVLSEAMAAASVDPDRAEVIYAGVRVGGWYAWRKHRKADPRA